MTFEDLGYPASIGDKEAKRRRDEYVDSFIAQITAEELAAIQETVALQRDQAYAGGGDPIRRADPRLSPAVRAQIFELLPKPYRPPVQMQFQPQGGSHV